MKQTKTNRFICLILSMVIACGTIGCGKKNQTEGEYNVVSYDDVNMLESGKFYIQHKGTYYQPYLGDTTYNPTNSIHSVNSSRIAWFGEDFSIIPTAHKGDTIVYHSDQPFNDGLVIERFEDLGYTIGINQLSKSSSGRFTFYTDSQEFNVDVHSDAGSICQLGDTIAVFDTIGGVELRAGNVSRAGTIIGLSKGKTYDCDIYVGTNLYEYKINADVRALCSMELFGITKYKYDQNKTITFEIPDGLQSGYYNIGQSGMIRYINSVDEEFSESMDMNIPNDFKSLASNTSDETSISDLEDYEEDVKEEIFELDQDTDVTVLVKYQDSNSEKEEPAAKIVGPESVQTLNLSGENELSATMMLKSGTYTIKITGLSGRTYSYRVVKNEKNEESTDSNDDEEISNQTDANSPNDDTAVPNNEQNEEESIADKLRKEELKNAEHE